MSIKANKQNNLSWVYWGTVISSLGTFTFPGATIGIMTQMNFPLWQIGMLMALTRLGTLLGSFLFGDMSERYDTKKVILVTETIAFVISIFLIFSWRLGADYFFLFSFFVFLRFIVISVAGPSRNKLVKILSDEYKKNHFNSAIALNIATYGPGVVGSFLGFIVVKYLSYESALVFDALTFIVNGGILLFLVQYQPAEKSVFEFALLKKIKIYFAHKNLSVIDILLALPFMGTNVLMSRLSDGNGSRVPLLLMTFGLAVFISVPLLKMKRSRLTHINAYGFLLMSFVILGLFHNSFAVVMIGVLLRNISYWYLYNLYTGTFQERERTQNIASLFAARSFIGTSILGAGELIFGAFGNLVNIHWDLGIRAILTIAILLFVIKCKDI